MKHVILALVGICLIGCVNGCQEDTEAPGRTEPKPEIHLGQGWSCAEWYVVDNPCPGESYCLEHLYAIKSRLGLIEITVTFGGTLDSIERSTEMTEADYDSFFELVERAAWDAMNNRDGQHSGCDAEVGESEVIGYFAGDAAWSVFVGGCEDQYATEIREQVSQLTAKYFPDSPD